MERRSRERWKSATRTRKRPINLQRRTVARPSSSSSFLSTQRQPKVLLPWGPGKATPESGPSRTSEKSFLHLLWPKPDYTQRERIDLKGTSRWPPCPGSALNTQWFPEPPLYEQQKSSSTTGRGQLSGYLHNCQGTWQPTAGKRANPGM